MRHSVIIPLNKFIAEHKKLINLLEKPKKKKLVEESKSQKKELMYWLKKTGH